MAIPLLKQSDGRPSASFTMMIIGFIVITLWLLASIFEELWGLKVRAFDASAATAYFIPLASLYFGRRWADAKNPAASLTEPPVVEQNEPIS